MGSLHMAVECVCVCVCVYKHIHMQCYLVFEDEVMNLK